MLKAAPIEPPGRESRAAAYRPTGASSVSTHRNFRNLRSPDDVIQHKRRGRGERVRHDEVGARGRQGGERGSRGGCGGRGPRAAFGEIQVG
jgi:hypothetical protein